eukprot:12419969-Karenia_brevis.AAC.1
MQVQLDMQEGLKKLQMQQMPLTPPCKRKSMNSRSPSPELQPEWLRYVPWRKRKIQQVLEEAPWKAKGASSSS